MVRRYGWVVFVVVAVTGIVPALLLLVAPEQIAWLVEWFGHEVPDGLAGSTGGDALARWIATVLLGSNGLTLAIAVGPLRRGDAWAWWVLWYWPAMFLSHALIYAGSARPPQVVWALVTAAVLVASRPVASSVSGAGDDTGG